MRSLLVATVALAIVACGKTNTPVATADFPIATVKHKTPVTTSAEPMRVSPNIGLTSDIIAACDIHFDEAATAPKFDFDDSALLPQDTYVLDQVAACLTHGALRGQSLQLVGRADPRGTVEYNFLLGSRRAHEVADYLAQHGVGEDRLNETSRGELDAIGTNEEGWRIDRRVDLVPR